jgi:hypothetical protein
MPSVLRTQALAAVPQFIAPCRIKDVALLAACKSVAAVLQVLVFTLPQLVAPEPCAAALPRCSRPIVCCSSLISLAKG